MSLTILVPVLRRPHRVIPLLESIRETAPNAGTCFICDRDDDAEINAVEDAVRRFGEAFVDYTICDGNYAAKINHGLLMAHSDLYFIGADDLLFHPGWLEAATGRLSDAVGVVGVNDLIPRTREHATHFLVSREYAQRGSIDKPDQLLHEGYPHEWVDDELIGTAKFRGAYVYAPEAVVEHLHPSVGKAPMDDLYAAQAGRMRRGRKIFNQRRHLWENPR